MTADRLVDFILGGGLVAVLMAIANLYKTRRDARREDQKTIANSASTIADAATKVVTLQDEDAKQARLEIDELRKEMRALQSESSAIRQALQAETEKRIQAEGVTEAQRREISDLRGTIAEVKAQFFVAQDERKRVQRENDGLKGAIFNMALGVERLRRQLLDAGLVPGYELDVPVVEK